MDWLFYIEKDQNQNIFYEGYKNSKIILDGGFWHMMDAAATKSDLKIEMDAGQDGSLLPLGRRTWKTLNTACKLDKEEEKSFTISVCVVGEQFSCDSGK